MSRSTDFYIHKSIQNSIFAMKLQRLSLATAIPGFGEHFYSGLNRRQVDWLSALLGTCGEDAVFDLRVISSPAPDNVSLGKIQIVLLCKVAAPTVTARRYAEQVLRLTQTYFDNEYEFVPVTSKSEFETLQLPFKISDTVQIRRRSEIVSLDLPLGAQDRSVGFRSAGKEFPKAENRIFHVYPFIPTQEASNNLFRLCLWQDMRICLSVRLAKTSLTNKEVNLLAREISRCEEYGKSLIPHDENAGEFSKQEQTKAFQKALIRCMGALKGTALMIQIEVCGESVVPQSVVETFGALLTRPSAESNDHLDPAIYLSGGFSSLRVTDKGNRRTIKGWKELDFTNDRDDSIPVEAGRLRYLFNLQEAVTAFRFPSPTLDDVPGVDCKTYRTHLFSGNALKGQLIGTSHHNSQSKEVRLLRSDRRRHVYAVGQTGTGKSTMFESMILDDMRNGEGLCVMDPHGDLIDKILPKVPPRRAKDVIIFDPGDLERPFGFNVLEYEDEAQKNFLIQELLAIIESLLPDKAMGGPIFFQQAKMVLRLVMSDPNRMGTLAQFYQVFSSKGFYKRFLPFRGSDSLLEAFIDNTLSKDFYTNITSEGSSMGAYIASKFEPFIGDPMLRNIFGQRKSTVDLRKVMDQGKILLVNLSKGRMGEMNARFFGMVLIAKLQAAIMSRSNTAKDQRRDFYLYVDEFQNLATQNFGVLLAEARKYRLNLILTNQFVTQVPSLIREAITGNVGTTISFRVGSIDAEYLERDFLPSFNRFDLMNLPNFHTYLSALVDGQVTKPFSMRIVSDFSANNSELSRDILTKSRLTYGRPRESVEREIEESLEKDPGVISDD